MEGRPVKGGMAYHGGRDTGKLPKSWYADAVSARGSRRMDMVKETAAAIMFDGQYPGGSVNAGSQVMQRLVGGQGSMGSREARFLP